jgi:hypothetical protein
MFVKLLDSNFNQCDASSILSEIKYDNLSLYKTTSGLCTPSTPVHLRRKAGYWTVIMVPTVITPYSTVQIMVGQYYVVRPYKTVPPYSTILTVIWLFGSNFGPKQNFPFCNNCL